MRTIGQYSFRLICQIDLDRDPSAAIRTFMPQSRYRNLRGLELHSYGGGPFCRFRIPSDRPLEGVYALCIGDSVYYVGECLHLSKHFNTGYGQISPRNCFLGGQITNCKIKHHVLEVTEKGMKLEHWFLETQNRETIESELITVLNPTWNVYGRA